MKRSCKNSVRVLAAPFLSKKHHGVYTGKCQRLRLPIKKQVLFAFCELYLLQPLLYINQV